MTKPRAARLVHSLEIDVGDPASEQETGEESPRETPRAASTSALVLQPPNSCHHGTPFAIRRSWVSKIQGSSAFLFHCTLSLAVTITAPGSTKLWRGSASNASYTGTANDSYRAKIASLMHDSWQQVNLEEAGMLLLIFVVAVLCYLVVVGR
jgi:hypothetical protein